jgi:hypothetical protein
VPSSNQATTLESQLIQGIQIVFGQTLRTKNALRVYWIVLLGGITALPLILALESANTIGWFGFFSGRSAHSIFVRSHRGAGKLAGDRGVSRQSVVLQ